MLLAGSPAALRGFAGLGGLRVELHPDGQLFFAQDFAGHEQEALQAVAEQRLPQPPDQVELFAERGGRAGRGRAQKVEQAHPLRVGQRDERTRGEILRHLRRDFAINRFFGEAAVFKKLFKRLECLVPIRGPKQQQFFKRRGAMRQAIGCAGKPLRRRFLAAYHALPRELLDKREQHFVDIVRAHAGAEPIQSGGHYLGIELLTIARHEHVTGFINQSHGKQLARMDGLLGMLLDIAHQIHAVGEGAARGNVGQNHVSVVGEKGFSELIALPRLARNVKFHRQGCRTPSRARCIGQARVLPFPAFTLFRRAGPLFCLNLSQSERFVAKKRSSRRKQ